MNTWHNRLQRALDARGKTWPDLVRATGLSKPSVYAWKPGATKRTKMMDGNHASAVCAWLKISSVWLFDNKGPSGLDDDLLPSSNTNGLKIEAESPKTQGDKNMPKLATVSRLKPGDDLSTIRQYDTGGAMGNGLLLRDQPGVIHGWQVNREWLEKNARSNTGVKNLCIVTGFGDSMRPMYNPGDPLLIDSGVKTMESDGVYFFRINGEGFIKRLQRIPTKLGIVVFALSENKEYKDFEIGEGMDFEILGKVLRVWCGTDF